MRVLYCAAASESCRRWAKLLGIIICKAAILEYLRVGEGYLQAGTRRSSCVEAGIEFGCRDRDQRVLYVQLRCGQARVGGWLCLLSVNVGMGVLW